jgi:hypothetical protein
MRVGNQHHLGVGRVRLTQARRLAPADAEQKIAKKRVDEQTRPIRGQHERRVTDESYGDVTGRRMRDGAFLSANRCLE